MSVGQQGQHWRRVSNWLASLNDDATATALPAVVIVICAALSAGSVR